ncbi:MAG: peptidase [Legionellaceae bacterium]|nr:peptidase [Legionellaceae bacterium]HCA90063.1 peptidase [Legionellales bacterium]|tara:strand:+ start:2142 stop:4508 length:2367 start_codon:yes stop_codon:yes gene_type:complete
MSRFVYFWRKGMWSLLSLSFVFMTGLGLVYVYLIQDLPDVEALNNVQLQVPLRIFTQDGKLIEEYGEKKRIPVTFAEIPKPLIHALLATEDQRFFEHSGVDLLGLGRATLKMLKTGTKSQGGSTITMQVARNFFLSRQKTFLRKFKEILLAIKIDRELSKEKILELYFNKVYLGNRAYGIGAAAQVYYGKSLNELSLAEQAMLAGLPQAPSSQNPIANPIAALKRRNHVLERLLEEHYISANQYQEAITQPLTASYHGNNVEVYAPYVAEMIRQSLYNHFGTKAYTKGYNVYTTIVAKDQQAANDALFKQLRAYDKRHGFRGAIAHIQDLSTKNIKKTLSHYQIIRQLEPAVVIQVLNKDINVINRDGTLYTIYWPGLAWARPALKKGWVGQAPQYAAQIVKTGDIIYMYRHKNAWQLAQVPEVEAALVALDPTNGAVRALVGGFSFEKSKFNRVIQSSRQPGSSFKPFIYAAALNKNYTLATLINDAPIVVDDPSQPDLWRPHNANLTFNGPTRLKEALIRSRNMVSIRVLDDLGFDYVIRFMMRFGFEQRDLPKALSLALGSLSISPMELAQAYAVFANGGYKVEPFLIERITNHNKDVLLQAHPAIACDNCEQDKKDPAPLAPRVIPADVAFLMNSALQDVIQQGTARAAKVLNRHDLAGKTGTTNAQVDAWFAGFNPDLVATIWVGFDSPRSLHEYAASIALPMWVDFMKHALKNVPEKSFTPPPNIIMIPIDPTTGLRVEPDQSNHIMEYFREQNAPTKEQAVEPNTATEDITEENEVNNTSE